MKIAIFLIGFPGTSEPWITHHVTALIDYGLDVDIYVNQKKSQNDIPLTPSNHNIFLKAKFLKYSEKKRLYKYILGFILIFKNIRRYHSPLFRSLNFIKYGRESLSFTLLFDALNFLDIPKYDIVHCHFGPSGVLTSTLKELGLIKCPIITTFHGFDINVYPNIVKRTNYNRLFCNGGEYSAVSTFAMKKLITLGAKKKDTFIWPMGVDVRKIPYISRNFDAIYDTNEIIVLTVARLEAVKGIKYAIEGVDLAKKHFPNIKYIIVGEGTERENLERLVAHKKLENNVHLVGAVEHNKITSFYSNAHMFLLPSIIDDEGAEDAFPVVLLEAQASGLPVVASRTGGIPESLNDGETGFLVAPNDSEEIARALCYLFNHPDVMKNMSLLGRKHVEKNYSLEKLNSFIINKYKNLTQPSTLYNHSSCV